MSAARCAEVNLHEYRCLIVFLLLVLLYFCQYMIMMVHELFKSAIEIRNILNYEAFQWI